MLGRFVFIGVCALLLSGCDVIRLLLPRRATTSAEVNEVLRRCGIPARDL